MSPDQPDLSAVSPERHAALEVRIRQRVVERCLAEARTALGERRFDDAEASLAEVSALDPGQPDVRALLAELTERRHQPVNKPPPRIVRTEPQIVRSAQPLIELKLQPVLERPERIVPESRSHWWLVAAAILASVAVGASIGTLASLMWPHDQLQASATLPQDIVSPVASATASTENTERVEPAPPADTVQQASNEPAPTTPPSDPLRTSAPDTFVATEPPSESARPDDEQLVDRALQQYRAGYSRLDADLVQAAYPSADRALLSQAFSDLASQTLVFEACTIDIRGALANATCRGTASYVPKIGSPEARIERLVWTFTLRRGADNWIIERAETSR